MWRKFEQPVLTQVGYRNAEEICLDVLLLPLNSLNIEEISEYKPFKASVKLDTRLNILLNKEQAQALNIDLSKAVPRTYKDGDVTRKILWVLTALDCILPVTKLSKPCSVYKYKDIIQGIEIMDEEESDEESLYDPRSVIVGYRFLEQLHICTQTKKPPLPEKLLKTVEATELEMWNRDVEELGLCKALESQGEKLVIGEDFYKEEQSNEMTDTPPKKVIKTLTKLTGKQESGKIIETQELIVCIQRIKEELRKDISKEEGF